MYVKPVVRQGLLARMLTELLDTRVMVKQAMKSVKSDKVRTHVLSDSFLFPLDNYPRDVGT